MKENVKKLLEKYPETYNNLNALHLIYWIEVDCIDPKYFLRKYFNQEVTPTQSITRAFMKIKNEI